MELQSKLEEKTDECAMLQNSVESLKKSNADQSTKIDNFIQRIKDVSCLPNDTYEWRHERTVFEVFGRGLTQTGLYRLRKRLKA